MAILRLRKYLSICDPLAWQYRRRLVAERMLYFSEPTSFNDPLDCNIAAAAHLRHALHECRVFCLSREECDDPLMFAHYADGHRGFRLTFEVDTDLTFDEIGVLGFGRDVEYFTELPITFDLTNIHQSMFIKLECWSYEAEHRILAVKAPIIEYEKDRLVEVAFGCKMNSDFEPVIRKWVHEGQHSRVRFVRASLYDATPGYKYNEV